MGKIKLRDEAICPRPSGSQKFNLCFLSLSLGLQPEGASISGQYSSSAFQQTNDQALQVAGRAVDT